MKYQHHYDLLIEKAKARIEVYGYAEKHHIIPKSLGGSNAKSNMVTLTGREHFIAHMLLARIHGKGLWQAAIMMKNKSAVQPGRVGNSRLYEMAKRKWVAHLSSQPRPEHVVQAIRAARAGSKASEETKAKMSAVRKGRSRPGNPEKWKHSDAAKIKMSESKKGKPNHMCLEKHKERMRGENNPMQKLENRAKISAAKTFYWAKIREQKSSIETKNQHK
jgi:hypothetical protein